MMARLLLVDDHDLVRPALRRLIVDELGELDVVEASSQVDALRLASGGPWAVAIVDVHLGDGNGLDVVRYLAAAWPHTHVIVVSAMPPDVYGRLSKAAGASAFVAKDAPDELLAAVRLGLAKRQAG